MDGLDGAGVSFTTLAFINSIRSAAKPKWRLQDSAQVQINVKFLNQANFLKLKTITSE
jgi:hypothetical protein